ncbi:transcriptional regulator [Aquirufa antheringensis]|uniref:Transcriptional regulator n=1 Tax=Aquirufa antheringensis TaxID=2516559 RepID=A0A4V2IW99_9BACT|nr:RNA-binding domain-containing protein [Aquirufa antheringensis]MCZ2477681.1 transcriptional regulator [Aquirufa antheringensis]MCZ2485070.1 transcriptional regulator [Aquirufa antheringensis]TBH75375.1 transcriptional regulator [Aquirufa antheringensis]
MSIPINIKELLSGKIVESSRMEFKEGWNPPAIMRTICAFANDFNDEGSGYIIVGVKEVDGEPVRPVEGFNPTHLERIEKAMVGYSNLMQPSYYPRLSLEEIDGTHVLVIWVPAGSNRPYKIPDDVLANHKTMNYRIRFQSSTIIPNEEQQTELIQLTAKIPFDDRVNTNASITDLSKSMMREHLEEINSKLYAESDNMTVAELAELMNLSQGSNEHLFPKNIGLLLFSKRTQEYFKGAVIDLVEFPNGLTQPFTEKTFEGPIQKQLTDVLAYINTNIIKTKVIKHKDREKADRFINYPYDTIEEALANAVYHRNYELADPIEVRILPTAIEIISYNGVDPSIKQSEFNRGRVRARRYRNRRIGEFLKELKLTEGRGTGIPTIVNALKENGSPSPTFDINEPERTHFIVEIPIHPAFNEVAISNVEERSTDQDADQDKNAPSDIVIEEINKLAQIVEEQKGSSSDQDNDQDKSKFLIESKSLLELISKLYELEIPDEKLIAKYNESSLSLTNEQLKILKFTNSPKSNKEIQENSLGLKPHTDNFKNHIEPLLEKGFIGRTIPNKPTSKLQKYFTTERGRVVIYIREKLL